MDMKRDYYEDIQLLDSKVLWFWFLTLLAALLVFPFLAPNYYIYMVNYMAINVIVTLGLNILVGYTGQISLGHAGFFAIGAYITVLSMTALHLPFLVALVLGAFVAALFGFILGLPALRLEGPYLAIATLGFGMAVTQIIGHWDVFGGRMGLNVPQPQFLAQALSGDQRKYLVIIPVCVVLTILAAGLMKSATGRSFIAVRDNEIAAETMGINLMKTKTLAFAVSAFYTGVAGGLMAHLLGFINPDIFNLILSIQFLAMVVVGGLGSILGSILGAILMTILPQLLSGFQNLPLILYGAIMVLIIIFEPLGLRGRWLKIKIYWKTWPF